MQNSAQCCHLLCGAGSVGNSSLYHVVSVILISLSDVTLYCRPPGVSEHHEAFHDCVSIPGLFISLLQVTLKSGAFCKFLVQQILRNSAIFYSTHMSKPT